MKGKVRCTIGFFIRNKNHQSSDYEHLKEVFRPSHGDYTYFRKYGHRDHRGGGRASARETISRVVAGAVAKLYLKEKGIEIRAFTSQVGPIKLEKEYNLYDLSVIESNMVRCPDPVVAKRMEELIKDVRYQGDTIGGVVTCVAQGVPAGLGSPVFGKLHASLGSAMLSINAAKGFEYGTGFDVDRRGSEVNDAFFNDHGKISTRTNRSGGIKAGIYNGHHIYFLVAFKPVATILQEQETVDIYGNDTTIKVRGRHDPCVLPRAVPIVEAMTAITIMDHYLLNLHVAQLSNIDKS